MSNSELVHRFYEAFARQDAEAMAACYHPEVRFSDPVFPELQGKRAGDMWRMLCSAATDLRIEHSEVQADDSQGTAHWEAWYTFSATGRHVHNIIDARFVFEDGLIKEHVDTFDFYRWTRLALGPTGWLLGWTPIVQNKVRAQAAKGLDKFVAG